MLGHDITIVTTQAKLDAVRGIVGMGEVGSVGHNVVILYR